MKVTPGKVIPSNILFGEYNDIWAVYCRESQQIYYKCTGRGHIAAFCRKPSKLPDLTSKNWATVVQTSKNPPVTVVAGGFQVLNRESVPTGGILALQPTPSSTQKESIPTGGIMALQPTPSSTAGESVPTGGTMAPKPTPSSTEKESVPTGGTRALQSSPPSTLGGSSTRRIAHTPMELDHFKIANRGRSQSFESSPHSKKQKVKKPKKTNNGPTVQ